MFLIWYVSISPIYPKDVTQEQTSGNIFGRAVLLLLALPDYWLGRIIMIDWGVFQVGHWKVVWYGIVVWQWISLWKLRYDISICSKEKLCDFATLKQPLTMIIMNHDHIIVLFHLQTDNLLSMAGMQLIAFRLLLERRETVWLPNWKWSCGCWSIMHLYGWDVGYMSCMWVYTKMLLAFTHSNPPIIKWLFQSISFGIIWWMLFIETVAVLVQQDSRVVFHLPDRNNVRIIGEPRTCSYRWPIQLFTSWCYWRTSGNEGMVSQGWLSRV